MPRRFYIAVAVAISIIVVAFVLAEEKRSDRARMIIGDVVSVSTTEGTLTVKEDKTGKEYRIKTDKKRLKAMGIQGGYRVEARVVGHRATTIRVIGMPMKAEPQPHQVIKAEHKG
jgi:hypothetical protein